MTLRGYWKCENCQHENNVRDTHCWECDKPRGWFYDGPRETGDTTGDPVAELAHRQEQARRLK